MAALITLEQAMAHLRITEAEATPDLELKMEQATAIVIDYIARPTDVTLTATIAAWTDDTVPAVIQAAILLQLGDLYRFRGDDDDAKSQPAHGWLSPRVVSLLHRWRDPALA